MLERIYANYQIKIILGVELEFYLSPHLINYIPKDLNIKLEKGRGQYEIDLPPSSDILGMIEKINGIKTLLTVIAQKFNGKVHFSAKPFLDDYGNSVHLHINAINSKKQNIFDDKYYCGLIASGLCNYMKESFLSFALTENCFTRFDAKFMAPTKICWGNNNRSVAIRIPGLGPTRLEHRVASAEADIYTLVYYIIRAIELTLLYPDKIIITEKIYGNAFDTQYNLPNFPKTLAEAAKLFNYNF